MITCQSLGLNGRFGNQMFQYATLYALGKDLGYEIGAPYQTKSPNDKLHFCLPECFELSAKDSSSFIFDNVYLETNFCYEANIKNIMDNTDIRGYFQTEKYFKNYKKDLIKKEFKFKSNIENKTNLILNKIKKSPISVHIRLGDYLFFQESHPICTKEYYQKAFDNLPNDVPIILFSDNMDLATKIINDAGKEVDLFGTDDKFLDMCLMTKCKYHIIANSSFSWWGAWLSNSEQVIAPRKWFGEASHMPKKWDDVYCEDWLII